MSSEPEREIQREILRRLDCLERKLDADQEATLKTLNNVLDLLRQIRAKENKIMATTKELLDEVNAATDALITAVNHGFGRLEAIIASGGQVSQADIDSEKAILAKLGDEAAKAVTEGV